MNELWYWIIGAIVCWFIIRWFFKKPKPTKRRNFRADEYMQIADRNGARCKKCGSTENLSLDHITPISKGGNYDERNLQILCRSCNSQKRDK